MWEKKFGTILLVHYVNKQKTKLVMIGKIIAKSQVVGHFWQATVLPNIPVSSRYLDFWNDLIWLAALKLDSHGIKSAFMIKNNVNILIW